MEKETLETAAVKYAVDVNTKIGGNKETYQNCSKLDFIAGANYQSKRISLMEIELNHTKTLLESCEKALEDRDKKAESMYNEEEILEMFHKFNMHLPFNYEFLVKEQFKKK